MNTRNLLTLAAALVLIWNCDEPPAYENNDLIYNPFSIRHDTISATQDLAAGREGINWGDHLRAIVGETRYYKAGFTMDFTFSDSGLDVENADSVRLQLRHSTTFPEDAQSASLTDSTISFGIYKFEGQAIDLITPFYGTALGTQVMSTAGQDNYWNFSLPPGTILSGDTTITLGFFPDQTDYMSFLYGGGSSLGPLLSFYYHEADTAGADSLIPPTSFSSDSVYVHLMEKSEMFSTPGMVYLSQLYMDSLVFKYDLSEIQVGGDTLFSIETASLLPGVDNSASEIYLMGSADSLFLMKVTDHEADITINMQLGADGSYYTNEIGYILQTALDAKRSELELVLKPNHVGYDPGFLVINSLAESAHLASLGALAVRP